jgi:chromosome segregation ATPase
MKKDIPTEIASLRKKLAKLEARRLEELREKLKSARDVVSDLERQIAAITVKGGAAGKRKRTPPSEVRELINRALAKGPKGLTKTEIREATDLPYGTIVQYFDRNKKDYRKDDDKRYLLK